MKIYLVNLYQAIEAVRNTRLRLAKTRTINNDVEAPTLASLKELQNKIEGFLNVDDEAISQMVSQKDTQECDGSDDDAEALFDRLFANIPQLITLTSTVTKWGGLSVTEYPLHDQLIKLKESVITSNKNSKARFERTEQAAKESQAAEKDEDAIAQLRAELRAMQGQIEQQAEENRVRDERAKALEAEVNAKSQQLVLYQERQSGALELLNKFDGTFPVEQLMEQMLLKLIPEEKRGTLQEAINERTNSILAKTVIDINKEQLSEGALARMKKDLDQQPRLDRYQIGCYISDRQYAAMVYLIQGLYQPIQDGCNAATVRSSNLNPSSPLMQEGAKYSAALMAIRPRVCEMLYLMFDSYQDGYEGIKGKWEELLEQIREQAKDWPDQLVTKLDQLDVNLSSISGEKSVVSDAVPQQKILNAYAMYANAFNHQQGYLPVSAEHMSKLNAKYKEVKANLDATASKTPNTKVY